MTKPVGDRRFETDDPCRPTHLGLSVIDASPKLTASSADQWLDEFFAAYYRRRPVNASFVGVDAHDGRLPDYTDAGLADSEADRESLLASLPDAPRGPAHGGARLDLELAQGFLEIQRWEDEALHFQRGNPSHHVGEAIFGLMAPYLARTRSADASRAGTLARLRATPGFLETAAARIGRAPDAWTERAIRECEGALAFLDDGWRHLPGVDESDAEFSGALASAARAFSDYHAHLTSMAGGRTGNDGMAAGEEAFSLYLTRGHFLTESAQEIRRRALDELNAAASKLKADAKALGYARPEHALADLKNHHPEADGYYARYSEIWDRTRALAEQLDLVTWPDHPIRYLARPAWARSAAPNLYFLFYRSPAAVNRPAIHEYLVAPIEPVEADDDRLAFLRGNNDSVIKLNHVVHHGSIGHHVQNSHARLSPSRIGRMAAVDCASRIAMFCGLTMAEGWACYATDLMAECGMLTPLERLAETHGRIRMCARAVVDVELHLGMTSLEGAVRFYAERAGMPKAAARREAVKNSMFPGAALIYMVGTDAIHDLRRELREQWGSDFTLRRFHDTFLSLGSVPVSLVARAMKAAPGPGALVL